MEDGHLQTLLGDTSCLSLRVPPRDLWAWALVAFWDILHKTHHGHSQYSEGKQVCPKARGNAVIIEILCLPCAHPTSLFLLPLICSFSDLSKTPLSLLETASYSSLCPPQVFLSPQFTQWPINSYLSWKLTVLEGIAYCWILSQPHCQEEEELGWSMPTMAFLFHTGLKFPQLYQTFLLWLLASHHPLPASLHSSLMLT